MRPASEVELRRLNDTFGELCAIASPFGHEREVADRVADELRSLGLEVEEDGAGEEIGGDAGWSTWHDGGTYSITREIPGC